jgi:hypothetical protein
MTLFTRKATADAPRTAKPRTIGPPPAPAPAGRPPSASVTGASAVARPVSRSTDARGRLGVLPPGERERRRAGADRRRRDRRAVDTGSPYGVERRTGHDDRCGDRRGERDRVAGIGLTRDYFSQADERPAPTESVVCADLLVRFRG